MQRRRHGSGILVLRPDGPSLDAASSTGLKDALREQIAAGELELCVDLDDVESMDSTGLGVLIGALRQLGGRGTIRLVGVKPGVRTLLHTTQMTRMFPIVDSLDPEPGSGPETSG
jgi:anti-sigma B factor antagonist